MEISKNMYILVDIRKGIYRLLQSGKTANYYSTINIEPQAGHKLLYKAV